MPARSSEAHAGKAPGASTGANSASMRGPWETRSRTWENAQLSSWMAPAQGCCSMSARSASGSGTASSTSNILHMVATSASRSRADAFAASNGFVHASRLTRFSRDLLCNKSGRFFTVCAQNRPRPHMPKHVKTGTVHLGIYGGGDAMSTDGERRAVGPASVMSMAACKSAPKPAEPQPLVQRARTAPSRSKPLPRKRVRYMRSRRCTTSSI